MKGRAIGSLLKTPVYLIGFMGAGKTSVGRALSDLHGIDFVDTDEYLESREGCAIADIFDREGEGAFREREARFLKELSVTPRIIATGGGVVERGENAVVMKDAGFIVYLQVSAAESIRRARDGQTRPLLTSSSEAGRLLESRKPRYAAAADAVVDTTGKTIDDVTREISDILSDQGILLAVS